LGIYIKSIILFEFVIELVHFPDVFFKQIFKSSQMSDRVKWTKYFLNANKFITIIDYIICTNKVDSEEEIDVNLSKFLPKWILPVKTTCFWNYSEHDKWIMLINCAIKYRWQSFFHIWCWWLALASNQLLGYDYFWLFSDGKKSVGR